MKKKNRQGKNKEIKKKNRQGKNKEIKKKKKENNYYLNRLFSIFNSL